MEHPAWLEAAWAEFGVREKAGGANAPAILTYFAEAGHGAIRDDETPWCAAFVGSMLARASVTPSGSLMARSYLKWGDPLDAPKLGAIAVLTRGKSVSAGHVGFYLGSAKSRIFLLGGNQGNAVTVDAFDKARVLGFRWPAAAGIAVTPTPPPTTPPPTAALPPGAIFERALQHVLAMEGGFTDDPDDPGGPTNKGITLATFAKWRGVTVDATSRKDVIAALKQIDDTTVRAIYQARYWHPASCDELPDAIAVMHFDAAVNHGVGAAIRFLQAAARVTVDGEIGPQTQRAIRTRPAHDIVARYANLRRERYRALPHFSRFGRGWLRRVDATERLARAMSPPSQITSQPEKGKTTMSKDFKFPLPGEIPGQPMAGQPEATADAKWWGHSKTVWGALITTAATVLPVIGPLFGLHLPAEVITQIGDQAVVAIQAIAGLFGTLLTIYGRSTASAPLMRRDVNIRM
ncbi:MAG TPA: TIGR02594 family protein [Hyphomicrobium sp.]|nr:TIGR02594 family protein [Hyphomicrobium sp.]